MHGDLYNVALAHLSRSPKHKADIRQLAGIENDKSKWKRLQTFFRRSVKIVVLVGESRKPTGSGKPRMIEELIPRAGFHEFELREHGPRTVKVYLPITVTAESTEIYVIATGILPRNAPIQGKR